MAVRVSQPVSSEEAEPVYIVGSLETLYNVDPLPISSKPEDRLNEAD